MTLNRDDISDRLAAVGYIADRDVATALWLMDFLKRPLLLEGEAGVGKTEVAKALAAVHDAELIRLQCYEGLDQNAALYEWNYQRQLLAIKTREGVGRECRRDRRAHFLRAISAGAATARRDPPRKAAGASGRRGRPRGRGIRGLPARAVVGFSGQYPGARHHQGHVDPARRADVERRRANCPTRCAGAASITMSISPTSTAKRRIIITRTPGIDTALALQIARMVASVRKEDLRKVPGVAETLDWAATLAGLDVHDLRQEPEVVHETMMCLLKTREDRSRLTREVTERLLGKVA